MKTADKSTLSDGELLRAFRTTDDQDAFAELVKRHGRMVSRSVRSVVENPSAVEDILQATFLTLVRKAASLEGANSVAGWLCRVAVCLARNERVKGIRRAAREEEAVMLSDETGETTRVSEGTWSALYEELAGLSEKYRQPVLLHHLEGLSYEVAAPMCGCTEKAFSVRLTRGRDQLRERLAKRGVALGMTALMAGLGQSASAAELPAGFVASTCAAASGGAVSAKVTALMESALKMLFWAKVKTVMAVCAVAVLVGGAGVGVAVLVPEPEGVTAVTAGMVMIPGGTNAGTDPDTKKPYSLTVESFLMDRCEVTKALWDEVAAWGREHGYELDENAGQGKAPDHPVHSVRVLECILWCNARSEKDGFAPVYCADAAGTSVRRSSRDGMTHVNARADGYRLATVVEWRYAARGGQPSHRFPWHDAETITHARANYRSYAEFPWDTSPTRGCHPTHAVGPEPHTSPVGAFAPNAFGLHDMVGNVSEWCPHGSGGPLLDDAVMDMFKPVCGGSWSNPGSPLGGQPCTLSMYDPDIRIGFRTVRSSPGATPPNPATGP